MIAVYMNLYNPNTSIYRYFKIHLKFKNNIFRYLIIYQQKYVNYLQTKIKLPPNSYYFIFLIWIIFSDLNHKFIIQFFF